MSLVPNIPEMSLLIDIREWNDDNPFMHTDTRSSALMNRVRERRKELGWTQQALADRAGVSRQTVNKIETRQSDAVPKMTCMQLARALDVEESWLFYPEPTEAAR